jgi:DNA-binding SARP family transcriptional activator
MVRLRLFGPMELTVDGQAVAVPDGRPSQALLAWLALNPGVHPRDTIAEELWPGGLVKAQRDSLKTALGKLRRALPPVDHCLAVARTELGLPEDCVSTDVGDLAALVEAGDRERALDLMRGELLPRLRMEWVDDLRSLHNGLESGLLTSLAEDAARDGDNARAVALTRRRIRLDRLDEDASLALIEHLVAQRADRAALDEFERLGRAYRRAGVAYQPSLPMEQLMTTLRGRLSISHRRAAGLGRGGVLHGDDVLEALHSFRWDAYLRPTEPGDPYPDFAIESVRISHRAARLPEIMRIACVTSGAEDAPHGLVADRDCWFRWTVDPALDPSDERVFAAEALLVDGLPVPCEAVEPVTWSGGRGVVHVFRTPPVDPLTMHSVDLLARSRVFVGDDRRVRTDAVALRPVADAEFRLTVSDDIGAHKITVGTSQITPLGTEGTPICGPLFAPSGGVTGALARFSYPLQQGSGVTFEIAREAGAGATSRPVAAPLAAHG